MPPRYTVRCPQPERHEWRVVVDIDQPDNEGQRLRLPVWSPGSYLVREYARLVTAVRAESAGQPVAVHKTDKHSWRCAPCNAPLQVEFTLYAHDPSVRGAFVDDTRAFFNGPAILPWVEGQTECPLSLTVERPVDGWQVATSMTPQAVDADGFGTYTAADYEELIDHPFELGTLAVVGFSAAGTPHRIAVSGAHSGDLERLSRDVQRICAWHIDLWGAPAPFAAYTFQLLVTRDGYGGLEHRASTSLIARRDHLPRRHGHDATGYRGLLGLFSHEYFHSWLVKRIRPAEHAPCDLTQENLTTQLWLFEGFTSYYDDLALRRCGLTSVDDYLSDLGKTISRVHCEAGHRVQTLEESSLDAWIKYYRPDENTPNTVVSYYAKGALVALALDLTLRSASGGACSLDHVMRALWQQHGDTPIAPGEFEALAEAVSGQPLAAFFEAALRSTEPLPLERLLGTFGVRSSWEPEQISKPDGGPAADLGARIDSRGPAMVRQVRPDAAASRAGLAPGDEILAVEGWRVDGESLRSVLAGFRPGQNVALLSSRDGRVRSSMLCLDAAPAKVCSLKIDPAADATAAALRAGWLGETT